MLSCIGGPERRKIRFPCLESSGVSSSMTCTSSCGTIILEVPQLPSETAVPRATSRIKKANVSTRKDDVVDMDSFNTDNIDLQFTFSGEVFRS